MSFIEEMIGVTLELNQEEMQEKINDFLLEDEILIKGYQIIRDILILTDKRIIIVDYIGVRGRKIEYHMIPYQSINRFVIETPGTLDTDYTLKLHISGCLEPLEKQLKKDIDIYELNRILFAHII
ncbi:MAG: PH domain-containing protein [Firmicutes bacterium]|nr:PH domain-containing protein [Bacillota bacterium]